MNTRKPNVEGPVTDHWGTWVSTRVPVTSTTHTPNFVMLSIDVAATDWNRRVLKMTIVSVVITLIFLGIFISFFYQNKVRDKLFSEQLYSTSQLNELANNDALTGLPNRRLLLDRMTQALKSAKRTQGTVTVFFIDLDNFKIINDTYGHAVGDELLKKVAARLVSLLREEDTAALIGGDEFIVLLPKLTVEQEAITPAQKILAELAMPFTIAGHLLHIGASVGIVFYPKHDNDPYNLIKYADSAMYVAKRQGRNCYSVYTADHSESAN